MTAPAKRFRKQPVEVDALQWLGDDGGEHTDTVCSWASDEQSRASRWVTTLFMPLPSDDAQDVLGHDEVVEKIAAGYSAVVYDRLHGTWVNVTTNDWIIRGTQGELYPCRPDVFAEVYTEVDPERLKFDEHAELTVTLATKDDGEQQVRIGLDYDDPLAAIAALHKVVWSGHMATCLKGAAHDRARLGVDHRKAHNPHAPAAEAAQ